ncbi:biotin-dependent carboxyltransferase family protein [Catenulispora yoronensis]
MADMALTVLSAGLLTTIQDLGRPGHAHLGVPRSGALDRGAHRLANLLVGNPPGAATLETTLLGCTLRAEISVTAAVTGAACPVRIDGRPAAWGAPVHLPAGSTFEIAPAAHGVRSYVAFAGGIAVPEVLGSRSTDLLSGLGPDPLQAGDVLPLAPPTGPPADADVIPHAAPPGHLVLPLALGPRDDWFDPTSIAALARTDYHVAPASNRVGLRLDGPALKRSRDGELPSEGMVLGAVQVPPDGKPVVFLADHPTTGGYPVVGVVPATALDAAAQARPGTLVRFVPRMGGGWT